MAQLLSRHFFAFFVCSLHNQRQSAKMQHITMCFVCQEPKTGFPCPNEPIPIRHQVALGLVFSLGFFGMMHPVRAQGTVNFNNRVTGQVVTHIYDADLCFEGNGTNDFPLGLVDWTPFTKLSGPSFVAQLLAAAGSDRPDSALVQANPATTFRTGAAAGNVAGFTATLQNVPLDAPVATIKMVAWDNASGLYPTWAEAEQAWRGGYIKVGFSSRLNVYLIGGNNNVPPVLAGLQSFSISTWEGSGYPHIFVQPQSQAVRAGSNVVLSIGTSQCIPEYNHIFRYQWVFNGSNLTGASNSSLTINNAQFFHGGQYKVEVRARYPPWYQQWNLTNISDTAILTVLPNNIRPELRTGPGYGGSHSQGYYFTLIGPTGMVYRIQTSTNLSHWDELFWVTNATGTTQIIDTAPVAFPSRYYRVIE
jgi:hypothetical protein